MKEIEFGKHKITLEEISDLPENIKKLDTMDPSNKIAGATCVSMYVAPYGNIEIAYFTNPICLFKHKDNPEFFLQVPMISCKDELFEFAHIDGDIMYTSDKPYPIQNIYLIKSGIYQVFGLEKFYKWDSPSL